MLVCVGVFVIVAVSVVLFEIDVVEIIEVSSSWGLIRLEVHELIEMRMTNDNKLRVSNLFKPLIKQ